MARSNARTLGLLNRWPVIMLADEWRFNQIDGTGVAQIPESQNRVFVQKERDYIARAIESAAQKFADNLGYYPAPRWIVNEDIKINPELNYGAQTYSTKYGYVEAFGVRATTVIDAAAAVVYSDEDGDGVEDWATVTVTGVTAIDADEIQAFFQVSDGAKGVASEYWRIDGLEVTKSGDSATLEGHKALFVSPAEVWAKSRSAPDSMAPFTGDTTNTDHFVTAVDIYREWTDSTNAIQVNSTPRYGGAATVYATPWLNDSRQGDFTIYTGDDQDTPAAVPVSIKVSYKAGLPLIDGFMDIDFENAIIRYANIALPQLPPLYGERTLAMWAEDRKDNAANLIAHDAWHPPAMGISKAGFNATAIIQDRHIPLKGAATYWYTRK